MEVVDRTFFVARLGDARYGLTLSINHDDLLIHLSAPRSRVAVRLDAAGARRMANAVLAELESCARAQQAADA